MVTSIGKDVVDRIRELYKEDETSRSFFDWAASRVNDSAETSLDRMTQKLGLGRADVVSLAKQLEDAQCGRFIVGRKGAKSRVKWFYSLRSLGHAAKGDINDLEDIDPEIVDEAADQSTVVLEELSEHAGGDGIEHRFKLRLDTTVVFKLPGDLTKKEAERLAAFIQSLPFEA